MIKNTKINIKKINRAFGLVTKYANGEKRRFSYQVEDSLRPYPYWVHLNTVFENLIGFGVVDEDTLLAGILHDIVEDYDITLDDIEKEFGRKVRDILDLCTKPKDFTNSEIDKQKYYSRMLNHLSIDKEVTLATLQIKTADRITNVIGVVFTNDTELITSYIKEARKYFIPVAEKVGLARELINAIEFAEKVSIG